jgi:hypothetical protein
MTRNAAEGMRAVRDETRKAREALEAKGAFTDANAATHIILALEALLEATSANRQLDLEDKFRTSTGL